MPQIWASEYNALPLRAHAILAGVPLHDAWALDLPHVRDGVTLGEFLRLQKACKVGAQIGGPAQLLLTVRFLLGAVFRLEDKPKTARSASFAARLTPQDRARSVVDAGKTDGFFSVVYRFENEQMLEIHNRTVHAAAVSALQETPQGYRYYFAVYVANESWITPFYMALIDPFRRWILYPRLLQTIRTGWKRVA